MADMQKIDVIIKRHKGVKVESSVARQAMQWNPLDGIGRKKLRPGDELWKGSARI